MTAHALKATKTSSVHRFVNLLKRVYNLELLKSQVRSERDQLLELSDKELKDMGITREQARREARRSFNDLPKRRIDTQL